MSYTFLDHTADIKFIVKSKRLNKAFIDSASALLKVINKNKKVKTRTKKSITLSSDSLENLLYNFLEEIIFRLDAEDFILKKIKNFKINQENLILSCEFIGGSAKDSNIKNNVKAITYDSFKIKKEKNLWRVTCILDV